LRSRRSSGSSDGRGQHQRHVKSGGGRAAETASHTWLWIDVTEDSKTVTWGVEGMSPNYLSRRGWTRTTFNPGDRVTVVVRPMRDGSPGGMFVRARLADGKN
jgi:hypothetical protein